PFVRHMTFVDDGSIDDTADVLRGVAERGFTYKFINHTGLPEVVKAEALKLVSGDPWVIMLDADERFAPGVLYKIQDWVESEESNKFTHVWFNLQEAIDGIPTRSFLKCRLFRKSAASFSDNIHIADSFSGDGANF